jgi:ABC-type bacteriocin/lantibiotic exporter with double-glycine peptidase domain
VIDKTAENLQSFATPFLVYYDKEWQIVNQIRQRGTTTYVRLKDQDGHQTQINWDDFINDWDGRIRTIKDINLPVLVNCNNEWLVIKEITRKGFVRYVRIMSGKDEEMKLEDLLLGWNGRIRRIK